MTQAAPTVLRQMTAALHPIRYEDLPDRTVSEIKSRILDTVGVALGASALPGSERAVDMAMAASSRPEAAIMGSTTRVSAGEAAFANGVLAHTLDYDDTHLPSIAHPSSTLVPAILAMAEALDADGREVIAAAVIGYEVCIRAAMGGYDPSTKASVFFERGWHATSICGTLGAAAGAARLLGLDEDGLGHAVAIAASFGAGILEANRAGGTVKQLHCGWAARAGIFAAQAAAQGFTGPPSVFEGRFGFFEAFCGRVVNEGALTEGLGDVWAVDDIVTKPFPTNHFTHSAIEAAMALRSRLDGSTITAIEVLGPASTLRTISEPPDRKAAPQTAYEAKFSAPFLVAMALQGWGSGLGIEQADLTEERLNDPDVRRLAGLVRCGTDERLEAIFPIQLPAIVRVHTADGETLEESVLTSFGGPARPLSEAQLRVKFDTNVLPVLDAEHAQRIWATVRDLERSSARELGTALLARDEGPQVSAAR
jgi:2-methylcitrate dehydratase PrpD